MEHFSFLLGSGFSVPEGYPTTSEINQEIRDGLLISQKLAK